MQRQLVGLLLMIFMPSFASAALPTKPVYIEGGFYSGNQYRVFPDNARMAYVAGVVTGYLFAPVFGAESNDMKPLNTCIQGMRTEQLSAIVDQFLARNPTIWDDGMNVIVYKALREACVKRGRPID